jgi:tRNA pseudouridine55 synthase
MAKEKEYTGSFTLGATTASYDLETEPENHRDFSSVHEAELELVSKQLTGEIFQVPPVYSAIKKNGQRSYDLARQGKAVTLDGRKVTVYLSSLCRTRIGEFLLEDAIDPEAPDIGIKTDS